MQRCKGEWWQLCIMAIDASVCGTVTIGEVVVVDENRCRLSARQSGSIAALYPKGKVGLAGSGGGDTGDGDDTSRDGICGSGDEYDIIGDDGGVDMPRNLVQPLPADGRN
ncbi:hypothetical protein Tco_0468506 [Tanacetum coccineum]